MIIFDNSPESTRIVSPTAIRDAVNNYLDEHPVSEVTMEELATQPITPAKTVSGTFRSAYKGATCQEKANNVVNVSVTNADGWKGVFFNIGINPNINNDIKYTVDVKSINDSRNYLALSIYVISGDKYVQLKQKQTSIAEPTTYTQTITKEFILENGLTSPIAIGFTTSQISNFDISVTNTYGDAASLLKLKEDVDLLKNDNTKTLMGKKAIFLGDSITALTGDRSWVDKFCILTGVTKVANVAVSSATMTDKSGTVLDGNPTSSNAANNTLANQVQKIINNQYEAPDLIIIAIGTNSGIFAVDTSVKASYVDSNNELVPLENLNRTASEGAFRWANETLHNLYPNAIICWCNPIQAAHGLRENSSVVNWANALRTLTNYGGVINIETNRCGIMMANEINGAEGEDLKDGLHPNSNGATKMARYNAAAISRLF